ncbi:MAG: enoyl-CoA hydratase/isomerase family protein [Chloroflexi bacterium]|nr:enoyl-CoA hydratase/isomerase family protein [Chloroflexota bacterium]
MSVTLKRIKENIFLLEVSRPERRNALNWESMAAFAKAIEAAHAQPDLQALILTGSGSTFIAGGDLKALHNAVSEADGKRLSQMMSHALNRLEALPCPVIAAINGPARGGGAEIALTCDLRIVAENASLGFVQISLGLTPGWGGGQRLLHLVGYSRAMEILLTGRILPADELLTLGLCNRVVPEQQALDSALGLARQIAARPPEAVRAIKQLLRNGLTLPPTMAAAHEQALFPPLWASDAHHQAVEHWFRQREKK